MLSYIGQGLCPPNNKREIFFLQITHYWRWGWFLWWWWGWSTIQMHKMFSAARCLLVVDECTQCSITVTFKGPSPFFSLGSHLHFLSMELHARFLLTVSGQSFLATKKCLMFRTILRIQKNWGGICCFGAVTSWQTPDAWQSLRCESSVSQKWIECIWKSASSYLVASRCLFIAFSQFCRSRDFCSHHPLDQTVTKLQE